MWQPIISARNYKRKNLKQVICQFLNLNIIFFRVCLDLRKLEGKKKNWKVVFFPLFGLRKVKKKQNREEKCKENLSCYEEKFFLPNIRGK